LFSYFVLSFSVVDPATARSERGEENTERGLFLPYPGFRSWFLGNVAKNPASLSSQKAPTPNCRFKLNKRSQLFIRMHNETLSVAAMRVNNPDGLPLRIDG
jgi:hypothetical protein